LPYFDVFVAACHATKKKKKKKKEEDSGTADAAVPDSVPRSRLHAPNKRGGSSVERSFDDEKDTPAVLCATAMRLLIHPVMHTTLAARIRALRRRDGDGSGGGGGSDNAAVRTSCRPDDTPRRTALAVRLLPRVHKAAFHDFSPITLFAIAYTVGVCAFPSLPRCVSSAMVILDAASRVSLVSGASAHRFYGVVQSQPRDEK
jgi:hypothetical protein